MSKFVSFSLSAFLVLAGSLYGQSRLATKQLSGPIEEITKGAMAPVDPAAAGIDSKSAMIPVELAPTKSGSWVWNGTIAVDHEQFSMMLFSGDESWRVQVRPGNTKSARPAHEVASRYVRDSLGMGNASFEGDFYEFEGAPRGEWAVSIEADAPLNGKGFLLVSSDSTYRALSYGTGADPLTGKKIRFVAYGHDSASQEASQGASGAVEEAFLRVTMPNGRVVERPMLDIGDAVFSGFFRTKRPGTYTVQVVTRGTTADGDAFLRTAEHLVPVVAPHLELVRDTASARLVNDRRLAVSLPVHNSPMGPEKYRVFAEVWGADKGGVMRPVNWIGGMVYVEGGALDLGLDLRWIGASAARGDFELRNVRIEDPDHFVAVARAERMAIFMPELPKAALQAPKSLDEEMLMGPRPERAVEKAAGGKLMLVHGYCSGDAWGPVAGQFSDNIKFQDFNQNRSHDTFAVMIGNFGAAYPSFGTVAHSQGGAASLHLYTYYWSGLDWADPGRLIQSVGTPYQGTALAGNAAVLGQIFGVGCGANTDLTYSGAANWLAGVPSWARAEVNYYTTAFKDVWWRYDYCHLVTDLLLNDPDDGTTEKAYGQLSGAVNRGHKSGWCHTSGMRDPAQVTDSGRNSTMNSNAAR